jgi:hypothetical protein
MAGSNPTCTRRIVSNLLFWEFGKRGAPHFLDANSNRKVLCRWDSGPILRKSFITPRSFVENLGNRTRGINVKKSAISILLAVSIISLCLILIPNVFCQPENVRVLSYSWYLDTYYGNLVVVGEVQNTGPNTIDNITLVGYVFTPDGTAQASAGTQVYGAQIPPQEKAPFQIQFTPQTSYTGDLSWLSQGIGNVTFAVYSADPTDNRQYQGLTVSSHTSSVDSNGFYMVTGVVRNTGTQATNQTWVVATFYNATGNVVAVGYSNYLTPASIAPGGTASFTVYAIDSDYGLTAQITSYALLIQTSTTGPSSTPSPSPSPSPTPTSSPSSSSPTPTEPEKVTSTPETYLYILAAVVIAIIIVAATLVLRKRRR